MSHIALQPATSVLSWVAALQEIKQASLQEALNKASIDMAGARQLLHAVKQHTVKPPSLPNGPMYVTTAKEGIKANLSKAIPKIQAGLAQAGLSSADVRDYGSMARGAMAEQLAAVTAQPLVPGHINMPRRGDPGAVVRRMAGPGGAPMTSAEHLFNNAMVAAHEGAERQVVRGARTNIAAAGLGHASPEVMLREHNMAVSLPPEAQRVKDMYTNMRAMSGDASLLSGMGVEYGKSPRLSRHAIKHLSRMAEEDAIKATAGQYKDFLAMGGSAV